MQTERIDTYDLPPIPWSRPLGELEAVTATEYTEETAPQGFTHWLATSGPEGQPHLTALGAVWLDGHFYFTSNDDTRKSRNLTANGRCAVSVSLPSIDLVVEGTAHKVTDKATLDRLATVYARQGWPATVVNGAFTHEYSAPSAGPPPWYLWQLDPEVAYGVATKEPHGATRWRL